jgi:hypothetical protein
MENKISENVRRNLINCHLLIVTFVPDFYFKKIEMKTKITMAEFTIHVFFN